jgi:hypothetical protein
MMTAYSRITSIIHVRAPFISLWEHIIFLNAFEYLDTKCTVIFDLSIRFRISGTCTVCYIWLPYNNANYYNANRCWNIFFKVSFMGTRMRKSKVYFPQKNHLMYVGSPVKFSIFYLLSQSFQFKCKYIHLLSMCITSGTFLRSYVITSNQLKHT